MNNELLFTEQRPRRADAVKNRALLLETAHRLFTEKGVDAVSMSDIAEAANVGKGTLYRAFPNGKVELCHALLDKDQRDLQDRALLYFRNQSDALHSLRWFLAEVVEFVERNSALLCVGAVDAGLKSLEHPAHLWWRQTIRALLQRLNPQIDIDYAADVLYVMLDVHVTYFQRTALGYDTPRIIDGLTNTLHQLIK
ncbi:MAG: TetR/AcrR family transcriptional regulator [Burkholderiales bacterium]|nr:TetR/AcrR family transcriptional regulator [Anaerolineae bacterium]